MILTSIFNFAVLVTLITPQSEDSLTHERALELFRGAQAQFVELLDIEFKLKKHYRPNRDRCKRFAKTDKRYRYFSCWFKATKRRERRSKEITLVLLGPTPYTRPDPGFEKARWYWGLEQGRRSKKRKPGLPSPLAVATVNERNFRGEPRFNVGMFIAMHELGHACSAAHWSAPMEYPDGQKYLTIMHPGGGSAWSDRAETGTMLFWEGNANRIKKYCGS